MKTEKAISGPIAEAVENIRRFISETTGRAPGDKEIAEALKRYFVLSEIKTHILMARNLESSADDIGRRSHESVPKSMGDFLPHIPSLLPKTGEG